MRIEAPANLEDLKNEKNYQDLVVAALRLMGWVVIHVDMMYGNTRGIPDLLCFRRGQGQMIELKITGRGLSPGQKTWQERWLSEGTEVHLITNTAGSWNHMMGVME